MTKKNNHHSLKNNLKYKTSKILGYWPFFLWLAAILTVIWLTGNSSKSISISGAVETISQDVAPLETARISSINVKPGERVKTGDIIAIMDTSLLDSSAAILDAQNREKEQTIAGYQQDILKLIHEFKAVKLNANAKLTETKMRYNQNKAELTELKNEIARREKLLKQHLIRKEDITALNPKVAALKESIQSYPALIDIYQQRVDEADKEIKDIRQWLQLNNKESLISAIEKKKTARDKILKLQKELLNIRKQNYILRAAIDGEISKVIHTTGEVVQAGSPIITIVRPSSDKVIGFLKEQYLHKVSTGQPVTVWSQYNPKQRYSAVIQSISPEVRALPGRISPLRVQVIRGCRIIVKVNNPENLIPGESVRIDISSPGFFPKIYKIIQSLFHNQQPRPEINP